MRTLSATLLAKQKTGIGVPYIRVYLVAKAGTPIYDYTTRLLYLQHREEPFGGDANVGLDNSDLLLASNMKGYKLTLGYGYVTGAGNEYSNSAPLWVISHPQQSAEGKVITELVCIDSWQRLAQLTFPTGGTFNAPSASHTYTIFNLIRGVLELGLYIYDPVTQTDVLMSGAGYEVVLDSSDGIIDLATYKPPYEVGQNSSYRAFVVGLLAHTKCAAKFCNDGKLHIFYPDYAGDTEYGNAAYPAYEYDSEHAFYDETAEPGLVIPNHVYFNSASYAGEAVDQPTIDAYGEVKVWYTDLNLTSNAEAAQRAECELARIRADRNQGSLSVPPNCGQELYDYIKITDSRASKTVEARIGGLTHLWLPEDQDRRYRLDIRLGGLLQTLTTTSPSSLMSDILDLGTAPQVVFPGDIPGGYISDGKPPDTPVLSQPTAAFKNIFLSFTKPTNTDYLCTEVWRADSNNRALASKVTEIDGTFYADGPFGYAVTKYYWIRARDREGYVSGWSPASATGGLSAITATVIATDLATFAVTASKVFTKIPILSEDAWSDNYLGAGKVGWNQHTLYYNGVAYTISAGVAYAGGKYIAWIPGTNPNQYQTSVANPTLGDGDFLIATNIDGYHDLAWNAIANQVIGSAYIQSAAITNALIANLAVDNAQIADLAVNNAKIADATIQSAKIVSLVADKISAGTLSVLLALTGEIRCGVGTPGAPIEANRFTGIRIFKSGPTYRVAGYTLDVLQAYFDNDGKIYGGAGAVWIDATGFHAAPGIGNVACYKAGQYTGNGVTTGRQITVGFLCKIVQVSDPTTSPERTWFVSQRVGYGYRFNSDTGHVTWVNLAGLHTSDGFSVALGGTNFLNVNGVVYDYVVQG